MNTETTRRNRAAVAAMALAACLFPLAAATPAAHAAAQDRPGVGGILDAILRGRETQENGRGRYDTDNDENTTTRGGSRFLRARITTDRQEYAPGRPVTITLSLTNIGDRRVDVNNAQEYDILVRDARNRGSILWQSSRDGQARDRRRTSFRIEPGQTRTYREVWDQSDWNGRRVRAGAYRIEARIFPQEPVTTSVFLGADRDNRPGYGGGRGDNYDDRDDRGGYTTASVRSELRLDQPSSVVRPGDTIRLTYTVLNADTSRSRTFRFTSGKQFDAFARETGRRSGLFGGGNRARVVWQLSRDQFYTQALRQFTLRPGERRTFTASWRTPRDLESGVYTVTAFLTPQDDPGGRGRDGAYEASATLRVAGRSSNGSYDDDYRDRSPLPPSLDPYRNDRNGRDRDDGYGNDGPRRGDLGGGYYGGNSPRGRAEVIRLRDLERGVGRDYVGRRVSVSGVYQGVNRGLGGVARRGEWSIADGGVMLSVSGAPAPDNRREGDRITVTGTLRRFALNGNYYLEAD